MNRKLDKLFKTSEILPIDDNTKLVIMSDCHRGVGDIYDNFIKNKNIYMDALNYYYNNGFTYVELGDGDEMWEVDDCREIVNNYLDVFMQLKKFHDHKRLIMIYGNHDITKKFPRVLQECFYTYYSEDKGENVPLLDGLVVREALVLDYMGHNIFLIHGHQVDFLNSTLWRLSQFLVKNVWKRLENIGVGEPTSAAKNNRVRSMVERNLKEWSIKNNTLLIAGHTHRPIFPIVGDSLYFNDGSCVHPNGITCIEIEKGNITLVKWGDRLDNGMLASVKRKVLVKGSHIIDFFN